MSSVGTKNLSGFEFVVRKLKGTWTQGHSDLPLELRRPGLPLELEPVGV